MRLPSLTLLATLAAASAALAQVPPTVFALAPAERFAATDTDHNGQVSKSEFEAVLNPDAKPYIEAIFDNRDGDKNGWLNAEEMNANSSGRAGRGGAAAAVAGRGGAAAAAAAGRAGAGRGAAPAAPAAK